MSNKSEEAYKHVLQYIKSNILDLEPTKVISDYETGLRNAFKAIYPTAKLIGCWFHFTNALRRKASKISNFIKYLNKNKDAKNVFNKFFYLPLLKPKDLTQAYQIIKNESMEDKFLQKNGENYFKHFINYFEAQWIKKVSKNK